ncbi:gamma-glutamyltransferase family protein [Scopulibacillus cellulosilyticus]|uniref:Gamma-glutamyltransferase family protein n=1 Tax=Scopulibacillus cellulosilyticus TaxID=2665665 RepID=A0ABW2PXG4_9BACL
MLHFDPDYQPYTSKRMPVFGHKGMVATSQTLAAQAGLGILKKGGNAVDAAIAAAACLTVVEPTFNGIGGDAFALIWMDGKLHGLNGSGPAPQSISIEALKKRGFDKMPLFGVEPITVPGAPAAWGECSRRFGRLPLKDVLQPAIGYAEDGFPVSPVTARFWKISYDKFKKNLDHDLAKPWFDTFTVNGHPPEAGEMWSSPGHAETLRAIAETDGEAFYRGELAKTICDFIEKHHGFLRPEDLADYHPEWVDPVSVNYRGYDVWEIPPNAQGIVALMALNILKGYEFTEKESIDTYHKQIEAIKLAFADGKKYIAEQKHMKHTVQSLLSESYAEERRKLINDKALDPVHGQPPKGGTVYLATADGEGNMVSFIQSNYMRFGSGVVIPGTGIALQNRGCNFSLDPRHDNCLAPGKKPYNTIIPGFLTKDGTPIGPFGVMGGFMQPQGHLQMIMNTIDFNLHPQAALDAPRWQWMEGKTVKIESTFPHHIAQALAAKGHNIQYALEPNTFGKGQIIWRNPETGVLTGGSESRTDGNVAAW